MGIKQQNLTPFERAALNRQEGAKRLAGIIVTQAWIERLRALRAAKVRMSNAEIEQWHAIIIQAAVAQHQHFGFDA
jgi:hypothetical protein